ncbi:phosphoglycolate phosphatase [Vibrio sp. SS-MA-C1-2]|uniref:phosphoglycolate phosphatase n=1 Tax=Vibrio sp. SS-MA-C1-2 TaxID=2908646 RepID=UPI001F2B4C80|nr:phosphoglycolate phosphatase [Vibrio sp. SS-MA-C1-2]UJF19218.1 phosphoglycolate phosphatase [Vibrio sp. SS-MA-C1-2]
MNKPEFIVFDLDGTLVDSVPDLANAVDLAMQDIGYPSVTVEQTATWIGNGADLLIARALSQSVTPNPDIDPELQNRARDLFNGHYGASDHSATTVYSGVIETLTTLKAQGIKIALLTNKPSQFVAAVLEEQGLADFFCHVVGGDDFPEKKPSPMALNWLMDEFNFKPEQTVMVGDSKNDILAAQNAKCRSIGVTYGYNYGVPIAESQPTFVCEQFNQLLDVLNLG